jgi:capsid protein
MRALRDLDDWQSAELVRKKTEACLVGIVFGADEQEQTLAPAVEDAEGNRVEQFEPGLIAYARGGRDVKFNQPAATAGIREWNTVQMHIIAAGFRVPYALLTGDLSQTNFSSSRVGINEFRRMVEQCQWQTVIPMLCQRVWEWFCDAAWTAGLIPDPEVPVEWQPPRFESVNPWQDAQTDLLETRAGFATLPQQIAKRGYNLRAALEEQAKALELADTLGLVIDSDPRKVSRVGQAQQQQPGDDEPPPPIGGNEKD